jgi:hypothetical protein
VIAREEELADSDGQTTMERTAALCSRCVEELSHGDAQS